MRGFTGFCDLQNDLHDEWYLWRRLIKKMNEQLYSAVSCKSGIHITTQSALGFTYNMSDCDPCAAVASYRTECYEYTALCCGELYNAEELRTRLSSAGYEFDTDNDTEVLLKAYLHYGETLGQFLNGVFSAVIDDPVKKQVIFLRDRFGVKPLYYTEKNNCFAFATEIKALFEYPGITPVIGKTGLQEIFGVGPAHTAGAQVFKDITELLPGHYGVLNRYGFAQYPYFTLTAAEHIDSYEKTVQHVRELLEDILTRQTNVTTPYCTLLSGGLDSSVVTALAASRLCGQPLHTYSFEFEGNREFYRPTVFQPGEDAPYAKLASDALGTQHTVLSCGSDAQAELLYTAVAAKDMPCMADIDSSFIYFCTEIRREFPLALCGECADEVFSGYPWCHRQELMDTDSFPWSANVQLRTSLLDPQIADTLNLPAYIDARYRDALEAAPKLAGEDPLQARQRALNYLNLYKFGATLIERKERTSMASALNIRMPFADHRLVQYVFNVPWAYKCKDGVAKSLLRQAADGLLPPEILQRKKSPYPKTYNPRYEQLVKEELARVLKDSQQPIHALLSKQTADALLAESFDYGKPWYGQLMAGPQLLAYLLQVNYWLSRYNIKIEL